MSDGADKNFQHWEKELKKAAINAGVWDGHRSWNINDGDIQNFIALRGTATSYLERVTNPQRDVIERLDQQQHPEKTDPLLSDLSKIADKHRGYPDAELGSWKMRSILHRIDDDPTFRIAQLDDGKVRFTVDNQSFDLRLSERATRKLAKYMEKHPQVVASQVADPEPLAPQHYAAVTTAPIPYGIVPLGNGVTPASVTSPSNVSGQTHNITGNGRYNG